MISLTIDGREVSVEEGATILEAAGVAGVYIPTFCYHKRLMPFGACRMCMVEVEQMKGRLVPSCSTPAANGMVINTNTPEVRKARRTLLELLLIHHPLDCPVCDKGGECTLQDLVYEYALSSTRFFDKKFHHEIDRASPLIERNVNRCVLCGMCARVCEEMVGAAEISFVNRGLKTTIGTDFERVLDCEFCGECVNICPVGALTDKLFKYKARTWELKKVNTICSYCSTGCTLTLGVKGNRIYRIVGDDTIGVNKGSLCAKGRFGYQYLISPERMNSPLVKNKEGELVRAPWEEALERIVQGFRKVKERHGAASIGGICSERLTNEEAYVFQKFMRAVVGTDSVDHSGTYSYSGLLKGFRGSFGYAANDITLEDIRGAEVIFLVRSNLSETHPVIGYQVNMAVKGDESKLIVASSSTVKLNRLAAISLTHHPASEIVLLNGIVHTLISERLYDERYVATSTEGFEQLKEGVARYHGEYVEKITGVKKEDIEETARLLAKGKRVCILVSCGLAMLSDDEKLAQAVANLALLLGLVGKKGSGIALLGEKCNAQGVLDMGVLPSLLPGYQDLLDAKVRGTFEEVWNVSLPSQSGYNALEMMVHAEKGTMKALYLVGENPLVSYPDITQTQKALESLEFLVVQDLFLTPTARYADVVVPVAGFAEKSGTYTNFEGRVQKLLPGLTKLQGVKTDLEIFSELSIKMGYKMNASLPEEVMREIRKLVSLYGEVEYDQLGSEGMRLTFVPGETKVKGRFIPVEAGEKEMSDKNYPLLLLTGSILFHSGSFSTKSPELNQIGPGGWVEVNPEDAKKYQFAAGQLVVVRSRRGAIRLKVKISKKQRKGMVFIPYHFDAQPVNLLTSKNLAPTFVELGKT